MGGTAIATTPAQPPLIGPDPGVQFRRVYRRSVPVVAGRPTRRVGALNHLNQRRGQHQGLLLHSWVSIGPAEMYLANSMKASPNGLLHWPTIALSARPS